MFHALRTAGRILVGWNLVWWPEDPNYQCAPGFSGGYPPINQPFDIEREFFGGEALSNMMISI